MEEEWDPRWGNHRAPTTAQLRKAPPPLVAQSSTCNATTSSPCVSSIPSDLRRVASDGRWASSVTPRDSDASAAGVAGERTWARDTCMG
ncbi:hypothetical protein BHE74_00010714 [Ensete ventricosum]|uniref:Uncharacterized protein n=1 Tax=Ensete ventricosum TaxID=4639 RepID=A0A426XJQ4_ENSVE|nr:hypothetical protein B296_00050454 [Ensete ventricosum]RWW80920.1 hypothetical protein BHE74_00010714 [Ensete ventricosum]